MDKCPNHEDFIKEFRDLEHKISAQIRQEFKDLTNHFDGRHDKAIETINQNKTDIAVLKTKQVIFALIAGMGGGHFQDIIKKMIF